ncbi:MAG TPA: glycosyltransferase family 2 protein [Kineosporiaceae bacterium]|jgi:succinoglycan biosynthesis protein ExoA|nr:glycosyltransferase family 2 protein [Kineosporiaceae bacterium]
MSADPTAPVSDPILAVGPAVPWPAVSVVIPVLNEERHLRESVHRILEQDYPGPVEVVLALGPSKDRTDEVAADLSAHDPRVRSVRNPTGRTPAGLNAAIGASQHPVVVRVDGHGLLNPGYIRAAVRLLEETGAANVGGVMAAEGVTAFQQAVARAMTSVFGVGGARFHTGGEAGPADTVYLGVFRREVLERLGGYDESFLRAQDWELNHRIRSSGGLVWFSPELSVTYRPRSSFLALGRQYFHYGRWRRVVMRQHPGTVNARYLAPPITVLACVIGLLGSPLTPWALLLPAGYGAGIVGVSLLIGGGLPLRARLALPAVLGTMHWSWGIGFLTSPRALARRRPAPASLAAVK